MIVTEGQIKLRDGAAVSVIAPPPPAAATPAPGAAPAQNGAQAKS
jgi:hypothetical protein